MNQFDSSQIAAITILVGGLLLAVLHRPLAGPLVRLHQAIWTKALREGQVQVAHEPPSLKRTRLGLLVVGLSWIVSAVVIWFVGPRL